MANWAADIDIGWNGSNVLNPDMKRSCGDLGAGPTPLAANAAKLWGRIEK